MNVAALHRYIAARRLRASTFGHDLFEDPAWDILIDLLAHEHTGGRVSVSSACIAAAVAPTTALRWIGRLVELGLLDREPDPVDRRRSFVCLTAQSRDGFRRYFAAIDRMAIDPVVLSPAARNERDHLRSIVDRIKDLVS